MKEKKISEKRILDTLMKKSFIEIQPICDECASDLMLLVVNVFPSAHFDMHQIEDNIYCLRINV